MSMLSRGAGGGADSIVAKQHHRSMRAVMRIRAARPGSSRAVADISGCPSSNLWALGLWRLVRRRLLLPLHELVAAVARTVLRASQAVAEWLECGWQAGSAVRTARAARVILAPRLRGQRGLDRLHRFAAADRMCAVGLRDAGIMTTKNSATSAETPTAAAKRPATPRMAIFRNSCVSSASGSCDHFRIERVAQRVGHGFFELRIERLRRERVGAASTRFSRSQRGA